MFHLSLSHRFVSRDGTVSDRRAAPDWHYDADVEIERQPQQFSRRLAPGEMWTPFDGVTSTSIGMATEFRITVSPLDPQRYRMAWTGVGQAPVFRTDRGLTLGGSTVVFTLSPSGILTATAAAGDFSGVSAGDVVLLRGTATGDQPASAPAVVVGYWAVQGVSGSGNSIYLTSLDGTALGANVSMPVVVDADFRAYSAAGVAVGSLFSVIAGFPSAFTSYTVVAVAPDYVEFRSTAALPPDVTGVPGVDGIVFYQNAYRLVRVEYSQRIGIALNGGSELDAAPWDVTGKEGATETLGSAYWKLQLHNLSPVAADVFVLAA